MFRSPGRALRFCFKSSQARFAAWRSLRLFLFIFIYLWYIKYSVCSVRVVGYLIAFPLCGRFNCIWIPHCRPPVPRTAYTVRDAGHTQVAPHSRTVCAIGPAPAERLATLGCTELKLLWNGRSKLKISSRFDGYHLLFLLTINILYWNQEPPRFACAGCHFEENAFVQHRGTEPAGVLPPSTPTVSNALVKLFAY